LVLDLTRRLDATAILEAHIHHDDVGLRANRAGDRIWRGACFAHNAKVTLRLQDQPNAGSHHVVVFRDQNAKRPGHLVSITPNSAVV
jgi:hypothetical protein